jgi:hypothetical protein
LPHPDSARALVSLDIQRQHPDKSAIKILSVIELMTPMQNSMVVNYTYPFYSGSAHINPTYSDDASSVIYFQSHLLATSESRSWT